MRGWTSLLMDELVWKIGGKPCSSLSYAGVVDELVDTICVSCMNIHPIAHHSGFIRNKVLVTPISFFLFHTGFIQPNNLFSMSKSPKCMLPFFFNTRFAGLMADRRCWMQRTQGEGGEKAEEKHRGQDSGAGPGREYDILARGFRLLAEEVH